MRERGEVDRERWSFWDEYLRSRKIGKVRAENAGMDDFIVAQVRGKAIPKAMDLRDKLPTICTGNAKNLRRFLDGKVDFEDAYQNAVDSGAENVALVRLKRFRVWFARNDTEEDLLDPDGRVRNKLIFELKEVEKRAGRLRELLEKAKWE